MTAASSTQQFSSEGFDLDAAAHELDVLELGGGITREAPPSPAKPEEPSRPPHGGQAPPPTPVEGKQADDQNPLKGAEAFKEEGNARFREKRYELAVESYTSAILATPGRPGGEELLQLRDQWQSEQDRLWREKLNQADHERRAKAEEARKRRAASSSNGSSSGRAGAKQDGDEEEDEDSPSSSSSSSSSANMQRPKEVFVPPSHPHGEQLAVYHCNRAAAYLQIGRAEEAAYDCDIALLLNPRYLKALGRRATAHERLGKTDLALADVKSALELDPTNRELRQRRDRLQKLEDERLEKLKVETFDKLKDLGNSILGNFGLSLDNFKAEKDPNTGSYSISFQQNN